MRKMSIETAGTNGDLDQVAVNVRPHAEAAAIEPMLTPEVVANLLHISKATLCGLTKQGKIPHKRIGDRIVRYSRNEIEKWMQMS